MKSVVKWAIEHTPTMNTIMVVILLVGVFSGWMLRREEFPQFDLELILVSVPYPGASPEEVETGICQKIEESIRSVDGIKKVTSVEIWGVHGGEAQGGYGIEPLLIRYYQDDIGSDVTHAINYRFRVSFTIPDKQI